MHEKINDNECDVCKKHKNNLRRKVLKHGCKQRQLSQQCYGISGVFQSGNLIIIESNK